MTSTLLTCSMQVPIEGEPTFTSSVRYQADVDGNTFTPRSLSITTSDFGTGMIDNELSTDFTETCFRSFSSALFEIAAKGRLICYDRDITITNSLVATYGSENCVASNPGIIPPGNDSTYVDYTCSYDDNQGYTSFAEYRWETFDLFDNIYFNKPIQMAITITDPNSGASYQETQFTELCLDDFQGMLLETAIQNGRRCSDTAFGVYDSLVAAFGEKNCRGDTGRLMCEFRAGFYFAKAEFAGLKLRANDVVPVSLYMETSIRGDQYTDFTSSCLSDFESMLSEIQSFVFCQDTDEDVVGALEIAFGDARCSAESGTSVGQLFCTVEVEGFTSTVEYRVNKPSDGTFEPAFLSIETISEDSGAETIETDFVDFCLVRFIPTIYRVAQRVNRRCLDTASQVLEGVTKAFGEENCQLIQEDAYGYRPLSERYLCSVELPGVLTSSAEYLHSSYSGGTFPEYLSVSIVNDNGGGANTLTTNFLDGSSCFVGFQPMLDELVNNFACGDSDTDVERDLMKAYGEKNCSPWVISTSSNPESYVKGWDCELAVTGYTSTARYTTTVDRNTDIGTPDSLYLQRIYADDYDFYVEDEQTFDFSKVGSCRSSFKPILDNEVTNNRKTRDCTDSPEEITYTTNRGLTKTTTCSQVGQSRSLIKRRQCSRHKAIRDACKSVCSSGEFCECAENPEAFPIPKKEKIVTCAELAKLGKRKRRRRCRQKKFNTSCPRTCGCKFQEPSDTGILVL